MHSQQISLHSLPHVLTCTSIHTRLTLKHPHHNTHSYQGACTPLSLFLKPFPNSLIQPPCKNVASPQLPEHLSLLPIKNSGTPTNTQPLNLFQITIFHPKTIPTLEIHLQKSSTHLAKKGESNLQKDFSSKRKSLKGKNFLEPSPKIT